MDRDAPIRVYGYPDRVLGERLADAFAAVFAALAVVAGQSAEPLGVACAAFMALVAIGASFQIRRRRKARIWLYPDRVAWTDTFGRRQEALLESVQKPISFPAVLCDAEGLCFPTGVGCLYVTQQLKDFGDLARRLEGAKWGWANRFLPPSRAVWTAPDVYRSRGALRQRMIGKLLITLGGVFLTLGYADGADQVALFLLPVFAFAATTLLDSKQYANARVERVGDRLVQFDRRNREVASVGIAGLLYVATQTSSRGEQARIEGEDGFVVVNSDAEGALALVENAYQIIADRHRQALERQRLKETAATLNQF